MKEEFELGIIIASAIEEMDGSDCVPDLKLIAREPWLGTALPQLERNGALLGVHGFSTLKEALDTADIVREGMLQQLTSGGT